MRTPFTALLLAALCVQASAATLDSFESAIEKASQSLRGAQTSDAVVAPVPAPAESRAIVDKPLEGVIARSQPSVATVIVSQSKSMGGLLSTFLGRRTEVPIGVSFGTGWVVRSRGWNVLLVTNAHVVGGRAIGGKVLVQFEDHVNLEGTVVGKNVKKDLALIDVTIGRNGYPALPLGESASLRQGDRVIALGSPLGLRQTATAGIFSALGLNPDYYSGGYLQTNLAINHGNSGGPLLDLDGRVVGVNFAIPGEGTGLGLAIPVEFVKQALAQYDAGQPLGNARLGATFVNASWYQSDAVSIAKRRLLRATPTPTEGCWISSVTPGSAADQAGLQPGDRIVAVDGRPLPQPVYDAVAGMLRALALKSPGDAVTLDVLRDGAPLKLSATLESAND